MSEIWTEVERARLQIYVMSTDSRYCRQRLRVGAGKIQGKSMESKVHAGSLLLSLREPTFPIWFRFGLGRWAREQSTYFANMKI